MSNFYFVICDLEYLPCGKKMKKSIISVRSAFFSTPPKYAYVTGGKYIKTALHVGIGESIA